MMTLTEPSVQRNEGRYSYFSCAAVTRNQANCEQSPVTGKWPGPPCCCCRRCWAGGWRMCRVSDR
eukprot:scaffold24068_cov101-Isochrysis_galbana.AAC.2